ncbi:MAG TPA: hypothetical protein VEE82_00620 [Thermodesulfovibrionales bacterium]|nr:hypothetical protein [Thermodesulfovibrionales bacterium]
MKKIITKYGGRCTSCNDWIDQGKEVMWDPDEKSIAHESCLIKDEVDRRQAPIASFIRSEGESPAALTVAEGEIVIDRTPPLLLYINVRQKKVIYFGVRTVKPSADADSLSFSSNAENDKEMLS